MYFKMPVEIPLKPDSQLGFTIEFACTNQVQQINADEAVRMNRSYRRKLWNPYIAQIERLLGFTTKPDEKTFAGMVAWWQCTQGIKPVDGIIGPNTWKQMRVSLQKRVAYNRQAAVDYAHRFWNIPCNDQFIALSGRSRRDFVNVESGTKFEHEFNSAGNSLRREHALRPNGSRIEWEDLDDCTHYISCCIGQPPGETAGGIPLYRQLGSPPNAPYGIVRVKTMVDYLLGRLKNRPNRYAQVIGRERTSDDSLINRLDPGDLIAYWSIGKKRYSHLAMYLGNGKIGCHTYCRFDDPACTWDNNWDLGRGTHLWTFLHFIV